MGISEIVTRIRKILGSHLTTKEIIVAYLAASAAHQVSADLCGLVYADGQCPFDGVN